MKLRAATRGSVLARWQTQKVAELLEAAFVGVTVEPVVVSTSGDRDTTTPIHQIGGKGVFVKEVQAAVLDGRADIAVHSAKDLPAMGYDELTIGAVPERADVRDALVGATLEGLRDGAVVGTGSLRRRVQIAALRPDLRWVELRGNIDTRLERVGDLDAIVMAAAALDRLGRTPDVVERLDPEVIVPQVGQGALAVECASDNSEVRAVLAEIDNVFVHALVTAERAFLAELGGDCSLPAGALAVGRQDGISLTGILAAEPTVAGPNPPVHKVVRDGYDGPALGADVARTLRKLLES